MKKKVIFIGNRPKVLEKLILNENIEIVKAFVIEQPLIKDSIELNIERIPATGYKKELVEFLKLTEYDICISAGCSYILPRSKLPMDKLFLNCHPSVLPFGKGIHPLNECFLSGNNIAGVTIHLLVDELDAGDILNQKKFDLTDDIDLSLLYGFIFDLEAELLDETIHDLIQNNMKFIIVPQKGRGTYYSREKEKRQYFAKDVGVEEFIKNTKAFSSSNLGIYLVTNNHKFLVFSSEKIVNKFLIERYTDTKSGMVLFQNKENALIKIKDGLIKLTNFKNIIAENNIK